jgi:hypothetical protein
MKPENFTYSELYKAYGYGLTYGLMDRGWRYRLTYGLMVRGWRYGLTMLGRSLELQSQI